MMMLDQLQDWHWVVLALALMMLEVLAPGVFFMWMGIAAGLVGGMLWLLPGLSWEIQISLFALLSVISVVIGKKWLDRHPLNTEEPTLNRRGSQYINRIYTLDEPIVNGRGRLKVDDTIWRISSNTDCAAGAQVKVLAVDGVVLQVAPVKQAENG